MIQRGDHLMIFFRFRAGFRESKFSKTKVKSNPSLSWAWPSSAPACFVFFRWNKKLKVCMQIAFVYSQAKAKISLSIICAYSKMSQSVRCSKVCLLFWGVSKSNWECTETKERKLFNVGVIFEFVLIYCVVLIFGFLFVFRIVFIFWVVLFLLSTKS